MNAAIQIDGNGPSIERINSLGEAIVRIMEASTDHTIVVQALKTLEAGTHVNNTISNCTFHVKPTTVNMEE